MNLDRFGEASYFHDGRFLASFRSLLSLLKARDYLRLTTILVDGRPAAVDLGCVLGQNYTLLAGGTLATVPGVAKLINIHHMQWACERRLACVDFLCGDFSWKTLFHLTPRPLFVLADRQREAKSHPAPGPGRHELWPSSLGESQEASNA